MSKSANIGGETVNARDLHAGLESKADYSTWFKTQAERARLKEGKDFVVVESLLHKDVEQTKRGGSNRKDYFLTIEAAKHIAMMSGTEKGYEVRDYFIAREKQAIELERRLAASRPERRELRIDRACPLLSIESIAGA